jgi:anti-sigma regulatory factor (Ser/Thr protein kinase)
MAFDSRHAASRVLAALQSPEGAQLRQVALLELPTSAILVLDGYLSDLMRELQIIDAPAASGDVSTALGLVHLMLELFDPTRQDVRAAAQHAHAAGERHFDVSVSMPSAGAEAARAMQGGFAEVQRLCQDGVLLSLPADRDLCDFFDWFLDQFALLSGAARYDGAVRAGSLRLSAAPAAPSAHRRADRAHVAMRSFPAEARSVPAARAWVLSQIGEVDGVPERCKLAVSELASNAVLHARTPFTIEATNDGSTVYVAVGDESRVVPTVKAHDLYATGGRGLLLVDALVDRWGTRREPDGKVVWFEIDLAG